MRNSQNELKISKMKKYILISILSVFFVSSAFAKKIYIDHHVTSLDGCEWHIKGWIDVSAKWGWPPIEVNHYDLLMSGPCGDHHFQGLVAENEDGGLIYINAHLYKRVGDNYVEIPIREFKTLDELIKKTNHEYHLK